MRGRPRSFSSLFFFPPKEDCSPQSCCPFIARLYVNTIVYRISLCLYVAQNDTHCQMQEPTCQFLFFILQSSTKPPPKKQTKKTLPAPAIEVQRFSWSRVTLVPRVKTLPPSARIPGTDFSRRTICFGVHSRAHLSRRRAGCPQFFLERL